MVREESLIEMGRPLTARVGILTTALAATILSAPLGVVAQDVETTAPGPTPSPMCSILTPEEVGAALGIAVTVGTGSSSDCSWNADPNVSDVSLTVVRDLGDLDFDVRSVFEGQDLTVGDRPAYFLDDDPWLYVDLDDDLLLTFLAWGSLPDGIDARSALSQLAGLVLPRLDAIPTRPGPTAEPEPSVFLDPTLQALMPTAVAGEEVDVVSFPGSELSAFLDVEDPAIANGTNELEAALRAQGVGLEDLVFALGTFPTETSFGQLVATRAITTDLSTLVDAVVGAWFPELADGTRTTSTIGAHEVTRITDRLLSDASPDPFALPVPPVDVLLSDGVLWMVYAEDPIAAEAIRRIP